MIQVKITKNVMNKSVSKIPFTPIQIVFSVIGLAVGAFTFFKLKDSMGLDALMGIVFIELVAVIVLGVVRIDGMNLIKFIISSFKIDKRPYNKKGVLNDDDGSIF